MTERKHEGIIVALINAKGGVGKSTTAVSLAAGLAGEGKRTLLVDLDAQGSAGLSLGLTRADLTPGTNEAGETLGVDIIARPPGKRASSLGMLSGGERTLTAVALLFAVLRVSPTPFCILDEVDAMLDEANVGRFRAMLQELGKQTQFLTITHNRGTVEAADTIYGVSMGEDGVSQVLSLSLEDLPASEVV